MSMIRWVGMWTGEDGNPNQAAKERAQRSGPSPPHFKKTERSRLMQVALFVPCYIDAFEPEVGIATLQLLERFGCQVEYPFDQTCCGQPMTNSGCHAEAAATEALFAKNFAGYDYIVAPSGSCVHQVRANMT